MSTDLLNKIDKAVAAESKLSSLELTNLLVEIDTAIATAAKERADALDVSIPADDAALERVLDKMTLVKNRMVASIPMLQAKLAEAEQSERAAVSHEDLEALRPEAKQLVEDIITDYKAAYKLVNDLIRLQNWRQKYSQVRSNAPAGFNETIIDPELEARRADSFHAGFKQLIKELRFVDFVTGEQILPPKTTADYAQIYAVQSRPGDSIRYSADWDVAKQQDIARARAKATARLKEQRISGPGGQTRLRNQICPCFKAFAQTRLTERRLRFPGACDDTSWDKGCGKARRS